LVNPVDPIAGKVDQLLEVALCAEDLRLEPAYLAAGNSLLVLLICPMSDTVGVGTAEVERSVRFIQVIQGLTQACWDAHGDDNQQFDECERRALQLAPCWAPNERKTNRLVCRFTDVTHNKLADPSGTVDHEKRHQQ